MINWISKTIWLVLVMVLAVAGCEQQQVQEQTQEQERQQVVDVSASQPPYISQAIEASGGLKAWSEAKKLEFDCVVSFYELDGSFYLTKQHHEIYPKSGLIRVSAQEPQGKLVWEYSPDGMRIIEGTKQADFLPIGLGSEDFVKAILDITTAPMRLLDNKAELTKDTTSVKIEGNWYYPIRQARPDQTDSEPFRPEFVFYQNRGNSIVDMLWFLGVDQGTNLAVRGYNYQEIQKGGIVVPAKIECFIADVGLVMQHRLVKIDYHRLKATK
ncbi:MAG: hypothetical protein ACYS67_02500 [Planctomycetota bacterium]|jgi:hypothetical protein